MRTQPALLQCCVALLAGLHDVDGCLVRIEIKNCIGASSQMIKSQYRDKALYGILL
jgi:hypothetical protein